MLFNELEIFFHITFPTVVLVDRTMMQYQYSMHVFTEWRRTMLLLRRVFFFFFFLGGGGGSGAVCGECLLVGGGIDLGFELCVCVGGGWWRVGYIHARTN